MCEPRCAIRAAILLTLLAAGCPRSIPSPPEAPAPPVQSSEAVAPPIPQTESVQPPSVAAPAVPDGDERQPGEGNAAAANLPSPIQPPPSGGPRGGGSPGQDRAEIAARLSRAKAALDESNRLRQGGQVKEAFGKAREAWTNSESLSAPEAQALASQARILLENLGRDLKSGSEQSPPPDFKPLLLK